MAFEYLDGLLLKNGNTGKFNAEALADLGDVVGGGLLENELATPSPNMWATEWEKGSFSWGNGAPSVDNTVIRTKDFLDVEPDTTYCFYDARDWVKETYAPSTQCYPVQYIFEYDETGTFIRYQTVHVQHFKTSANCKKVKFRSNNGGAFIDMETYNAKPFQLQKGYVYRTRYDRNPQLAIEKEFSGLSDNLFDGETSRYLMSYDVGQNVDIYTDQYVQVSTRFIDISNHAGVLYYLIPGTYKQYFDKVSFYNENKDFISGTTITNVDVTNPAGDVKSANVPTTAKFAIITMTMVTNTAEHIAMVDTMETDIKNGLFVSYDLEKVYARYFIDGKNKILSEDTNAGFYDGVYNENVRPFMLNAAEEFAGEVKPLSFDFAFGVITDIHTRLAEPYAIMNTLSNSGALDMFANLGDNIPDHYATKQEAVAFLGEVFNNQTKPTSAPLYNLVGNHDTNPVNASNISDGSNMVKPNEFYSLSNARTHEGLSNMCYGFKDFENAKIRVVFLNTSDIFADDGTPLIDGYNTAVQETQFEWFCNTALDLSDKKNPQEWAVVTMAHDRLSVVGNGAFETAITAFSNGTAATASGTRTVNNHTFQLSVNVDYTAQGGCTYVGHICGHSHDDAMYTFATYWKEVQTACAIRTGYYYENGTRKTYTREKGTTDEIIVDIFGVDKETKTVTIKRFGVGSDRAFTYI